MSYDASRDGFTRLRADKRGEKFVLVQLTTHVLSSL